MKEPWRTGSHVLWFVLIINILAIVIGHYTLAFYCWELAAACVLAILVGIIFRIGMAALKLGLYLYKLASPLFLK